MSAPVHGSPSAHRKATYQQRSRGHTARKPSATVIEPRYQTPPFSAVPLFRAVPWTRCNCSDFCRSILPPRIKCPHEQAHCHRVSQRQQRRCTEIVVIRPQVRETVDIQRCQVPRQQQSVNERQRPDSKKHQILKNGLGSQRSRDLLPPRKPHDSTDERHAGRQQQQHVQHAVDRENAPDNPVRLVIAVAAQ